MPRKTQCIVSTKKQWLFFYLMAIPVHDDVDTYFRDEELCHSKEEEGQGAVHARSSFYFQSASSPVAKFGREGILVDIMNVLAHRVEKHLSGRYTWKWGSLNPIRDVPY